MKTIGSLKIGDRVQATNKIDGTQHGTVISMRNPKDPTGTEQNIYCCVVCVWGASPPRLPIALSRSLPY